MLFLWPVLAMSFVISFAVTPALRNVGVRLDLVDDAHDLRRVHSRAVPRIGGLAIVAGMYGGIAAGLVIPSSRSLILADGWALVALLLASLFVATAGLYDDVLGARATKKLAVQVIAAVLLYAAGFRITALDLPLGDTIQLGILSAPLTILWMVGVTNAVNLIDGLDGLAAGIAAIAAITLGGIGVLASDATTVTVGVAVTGALLGFLRYNVHPSSIFMGDTGSLFLGTTLGALSIRVVSSHGGLPSPSLLAMALVFAVPITDTVLAVARRAARGAPMFSADRDHLHHRLLLLGLPHGAAVVVLWGAAAAFAAGGAWMAVWPDPRNRLAVFGGAVATILLLIHQLGYFGRAGPAVAERRRRNRERLRTVRGISARLRTATTVDDVRSELAGVAGVLDATIVTLTIQRRRTRVRRRADCVLASQGGYRKAFPLDPSDPRSRLLDVEWGRDPKLDRDMEVAIELLCRSFQSAFDRFERTSAVAPPTGARPLVVVREGILELVPSRPSAEPQSPLH